MLSPYRAIDGWTLFIAGASSIEFIAIFFWDARPVPADATSNETAAMIGGPGPHPRKPLNGGS